MQVFFGEVAPVMEAGPRDRGTGQKHRFEHRNRGYFATFANLRKHFKQGGGPLFRGELSGHPPFRVMAGGTEFIVPSAII